MIRKARIQDAMSIKSLIGEYAETGEMLPRALGEIYDHLRDFHVFEDNGEITGVCALHIGWEGLAEVRSLAVRSGHTGKGIGSALVRSCLDEAVSLGVENVFVLTFVADFFAGLGFGPFKNEDLPQKIWTECRNKCVKYPDKCNEVALIIELS